MDETERDAVERQVMQETEREVTTAQVMAQKVIASMEESGISPEVIAMIFMTHAIEFPAKRQERNIQIQIMDQVERSYRRMQDDLRHLSSGLQLVD